MIVIDWSNVCVGFFWDVQLFAQISVAVKLLGMWFSFLKFCMLKNNFLMFSVLMVNMYKFVNSSMNAWMSSISMTFSSNYACALCADHLYFLWKLVDIFSIPLTILNTWSVARSCVIKDEKRRASVVYFDANEKMRSSLLCRMLLMYDQNYLLLTVDH
jgi:hypothetical protein